MRIWAAKLPVLIVTLVIPIGCAHGPSATTTHRVTVGQLDEPLANASTAHWQADPDRLVADVTRSFRDLHWGKLKLTRVPDDEDQPFEHLRARALLPDGRTATVFAWPHDQQHISVTVRVGPFGDRDAEQRFVDMLAKTLRGKPKPKRGGKFKLPDS